MYVVMVSIHHAGDLDAEFLLSPGNTKRVKHLQHLNVNFTFRSVTNLGISNGSMDGGALKYWKHTTKRAIGIVESAQIAFNARIRCVSLFLYCFPKRSFL